MACQGSPDTELVQRALLFAREAHKFQKDDDGKDYFNAHLVPTVQILMVITADPALWAAGYLHDVIEDCGVSYTQLRRLFGLRVATLVRAVTHEGQPDHRGYYFPRLSGRDAALIKFADRLSNLSRMDSWDIGRQEHYLRKSKFWSNE